MRNASRSTQRAERSFNNLSWIAVIFVGVVVITLVLGLQLLPRLHSGEQVVDGARAAFTDERVAGDRAGVNMVSNIVNLADPIVTDQRTVAEVKGLITFVSQKTGLPEAQVVATLQARFPHSLALLQAIPLSSVTQELPLLIAFVANQSHLSVDAVTNTINQGFPHLAQAIAALPTVTAGWNHVPGTDGVTRFDGSAVATVPQVRDYLSLDVVAAVEGQRANFQQLDGTWPRLIVIPIVVLAIGIIATLYGLLMLVLFNRRGVSDSSGPRVRRFAFLSWAVIAIVGVLVLALVPLWSLFGRLDAGNQTIAGLRPAFTDARIAGDVAGVSMVSTIVDLADPVVLKAGGASEEVPRLIAVVANATGLSAAQVTQALQTNFPHTFALLSAIPLEAVSQELPALASFLTTTLKLTPEQLTAALQQNFPRLAQSLTFLPMVTSGWASVPGTDNLTRFDGSAVHSVPQVRDYFQDDIVPVLTGVNADFQKVDSLPPPVTWVFPLLVVAGVLVLYYGMVMMYLWRPRPDQRAAVDFSGSRAPAAR